MKEEKAKKIEDRNMIIAWSLIIITIGIAGSGILGALWSEWNRGNIEITWPLIITGIDLLCLFTAIIIAKLTYKDKERCYLRK